MTNDFNNSHIEDFDSPIRPQQMRERTQYTQVTNTPPVQMQQQTFDEYNDRLSFNRASEVAGYLIRKGVRSSRVSYAGFGCGRLYFADERLQTNGSGRKLLTGRSLI